MKLLSSLLLMTSVPAFAVNLTYECEGMWAATASVLKANAAIEGEFDPNGTDVLAKVNLETGAALTGSFSGPGAYFSSGSLIMEGGRVIYRGSLTKISAAGSSGSGGFKFEAPEVSAIFQCRIKR